MEGTFRRRRRIMSAGARVRRPPFGKWSVRRSRDGRTTTVAGFDGMGAIPGIVLGSFCLPAGYEALGWRGAPLVILGWLVLFVAPFRHRVVVGPGGMRYVRSWMGLPWRTRRYSLEARVGCQYSFEEQWVEIGEPADAILHTRPDEESVVRTAIVDAIARARKEPSSP